MRVLGLYSVWSTIPKWFSVSVYLPSYEWTCVSLCICEAGAYGEEIPSRLEIHSHATLVYFLFYKARSLNLDH